MSRTISYRRTGRRPALSRPLLRAPHPSRRSPPAFSPLRRPRPLRGPPNPPPPSRASRPEPVYLASPLGVLDLVGPLKGLVDPPGESRDAVRGIQALVRVRLAREVRVCGNLPAAEIDRLEARLDHLNRLTAG